MNRVEVRIFWISISVIAVVLTCRLVWRTSPTETGPGLLRDQWRDATAGLFAGETAPLAMQLPKDQARRLLSEASELQFDAKEHRGVEVNKPALAELAIGAALTLDSPSPEFINRFLISAKLNSSPTLDTQAIEIADGQFADLCGKRCVELVRIATELDPDNRQWWRLRALMLWPSSLFTANTDPRTEDWEEILAEASRHDPDNALYDYLAAGHYIELSTRVDFEADGPRLLITDQEQFNRGLEYFKRGQKKSVLTVGDAGPIATERYLRHTSIPPISHPSITKSRSTRLRGTASILDITRNHGFHANAVESEMGVRAAVEMDRESLHVVRQYFRAGKAAKLHFNPYYSLAATATQMRARVRRHPSEFFAAEAEEINALVVNALVDQKLVQQARAEVTTQLKAKETAANSKAREWGLAAAMVVFFLPRFIVVLLITAVLCGCLSRFSSDIDPSPPGVVLHALILLLAFGFTFTVFGLAPAKVISAETQTRLLTALIPIMPAFVVVSFLLRRQSFRFSLRTMLGCTCVFGILFAAIASLAPSADWFGELSYDWSIPQRNWTTTDISILRNVYQSKPKWHWTVFQWIAYFGPYASIAIWATVVAIFLRFKTGRHGSTTKRSVYALRFISTWARSMARPCFSIAAIAGLLYLFAAPRVVEDSEAEFQKGIAFARDPNSYWTPIENAYQRVLNDSALVEDIRGAAIAEAAELGLEE